ncbi:uncharacterized protein LOC128989820 isoform X1 [Macrosteles quadrilineatus]|uniref:uncharacterized protein LOC128989820 isoform X1 n=1 Tax=Macrosteles quadrilineatus TaxID=74068 RepID=UPI0023E0DB64|nr:uncharacterized protein LOC128989820 isoform X1 [Macrosteles quadrilineatus]
MTDRSPRSLPPLIEGNSYGRLSVRIDEILWCSKLTNEVIVVLQWWGDVDSVTFRPADISKYPESVKSNNTVQYNIQTNISLFETYLKQCNKLKLLVVNDENKEIVGHVEISNLLDHITKIQLQKYFPIVTSSGKRIGDLRVDFELSMNASSEETSKKTRKRSRKKSKTGINSSRSTIEEEKSKQFKKGYKTCPTHINIPKDSSKEKFVNFDMPESPKTNQAPPNTGRSEASDYVLLDVLEKGKKLRDAMVLSVLEDSDYPVDIHDELLLKLDNNDEKYNKTAYKSSSSTKSGELVTPHEEKLISNYLEGKVMKEEEEKLVLATLHSENLHGNSVVTNDLQNQDNCNSANTSCPPSTFGHPAGTSNIGINSLTVAGKNVRDLMKKINCFRITVDSLTLTPAGWKKINQAVDNKNKNGDLVPPPGATYFVECQFVEDSPRSQAQSWKASPLRFCSRRQIQDVVYFGQSSAHSLKPPHTLQELEDANCLVCWRHLHQRVPALLGTFRLAPLPPGSVEMEDTLPVISDNVTVVGHIKIKLQLGKDKLYYGNDLLDESPHDVPTVKTPNETERDITFRSKETPRLNMKDLEGKTVSVVETSTVRNHKDNHNIQPPKAPMSSCVKIPACTNCGQNMILPNLQTPDDTSLCISCSSLLGQHQSLSRPNFEINIPKNFTYKERRHHEFLLGIDSVKGFPLFADGQEELSCYIDYKFPQITPGFKVEMSRSETTSRVVAVETQPCLASVHRHSLVLPVMLPLSPLLTACSSGVTLRLWLRYYKPTPRDHMVAMALLPMDDLCLMELEFDERQQEIAITKVLELPLALVPSSVTSPYQKCPSGTLRVSVTYSNFIAPPTPVQTRELQANVESKGREGDRHASHHELKPISALLDRISATCPDALREPNTELAIQKNRFWIGPFNTDNHCLQKSQDKGLLDNPVNNTVMSNNKVDSAKERDQVSSSRPVMKEDLDILAESIEHRFNRLQSELLKEKQRGLAEVSSIVTGSKKINSSLNGDLDDFLSFHSPLSSNSSMESLPFILGPPADFKDTLNTVAHTGGKAFSESTSDKSVSDTITGFFKEEKDVANYVSNESLDKNIPKPEKTKPKTFKAMIKIDRAVNLKAVKAPSNGKKGKVPPSSWVSFGIGDCCEQNCGTGGLVCAGPRFTTPVVRRNHNPIWNLSWDVDLPVEYLQKEEKRLVFSVFEEQLSLCVGRASTSVAILRSGLPCLSTWLSIDDSQGACRGQLKVVVTPLEDVQQYQNCSVFDIEEDYFEEPKEEILDNILENERQIVPAFVASQTEVFLNEGESTSSEKEKAHDINDQIDNTEAIEGEDPFLADDIISDYKNTLENNFRNEMAGLENLIKFLRVGSMSSELSFFRSTENKENLSSNPSPQYYGGDTRSAVLEPLSNASQVKMPASNHSLNHSSQKDRCLLDATTETGDNCGYTSTQQNGEDILSKLLHQISNFQPASIKITDNTSQTLPPETKESSTETSDKPEQSETSSVCMKDASTETDDITEQRSPQNENLGSRHVCEELGNVLLQHFLTCKPPPVKVADGVTQTDCQDGVSTVNSSGVFMSGISVDSRDLQDRNQSRAQTSGSAPDNNLRDLEKFLKQKIPVRQHTCGSSEGSVSSTSVNELMDFSGKDSRSSSDLESLESYSQVTVQPRETPDGGNPSVAPDPPSNSGNMETSVRRRGTFVISKATGDNEHPEEKPSGNTA